MHGKSCGTKILGGGKSCGTKILGGGESWGAKIFGVAACSAFCFVGALMFAQDGPLTPTKKRPHKKRKIFLDWTSWGGL